MAPVMIEWRPVDIFPRAQPEQPPACKSAPVVVLHE